MIKAVFRVQGDNEIYMKVTGHAGAGPAGHDLVCAAASILAFTAAQDAADMHRDGRMREEPKIKLRHGCTTIRVKPKDDAYAELLHTFFVVQKGFVVLAANNPASVTVTPMTINA